MSVDQSIDRLEHDATATRRRLASTLDELTGRLTPGGVLDEVLTYAKAGSGDLMRGLGKSAAANPLPTLLIGVGCALFLSGKGRLNGDRDRDTYTGPRRDARFERQPGLSRTESREYPYDTDDIQGRAGSVMSSVSHAAAAAGSVVAGTAESVRRGTVSAASSIADKARSGVTAVGAAVGGVVTEARDGALAIGDTAAETAADVAKTVGSAVGTASEYAGTVKDRIAARGRRAGLEASRMGSEMTDTAKTFVREQPLLVAAGGLVIGAAIAALLPRTKVEDSMMGETSDAVKGTIEDVASEQFKTAKAAVKRVGEEVADTARAEGLSPDSASETLRELGEKVSKVATAGADAAGEEAGKILQGTR